MKTKEFVELLKEIGVSQVSAVPCSVIKGVIETLEKDKEIKYVPMNREDNLLSWAAGVYLAGEKPFIMLQNSGIGNFLDILISIQQTYRIPLVMLITWRGLEKKDEVQHWIWGEVQNAVLNAVKLPYIIFEKEDTKIKRDVKKAFKLAGKLKTPVALILKRGNYIDETN